MTIKEKNGSTSVVHLSIDVFNLKLFALLMCRGKPREKAEFLFDAILGFDGVKKEKETLSWQSSRMRAAFYKLIYFSEFVPRLYYD